MNNNDEKMYLAENYSQVFNTKNNVKSVIILFVILNFNTDLQENMAVWLEMGSMHCKFSHHYLTQYCMALCEYQ